MSRIRIEPITAESTIGWREPIEVEFDSVPQEGDYIEVTVAGHEYTDLYVRKVLWVVSDDGSMGVYVRVR